jgi:hypothetical protein
VRESIPGGAKVASWLLLRRMYSGGSLVIVTASASHRCPETVLMARNAELHVDPGTLHANQVRVIPLPRHCQHLPQPLDVARAKPFPGHFFTLVPSRADHELARLFGMLDGTRVATASAAMEERVTFVMCALEACGMPNPCFTSL